MAHTPLIFLKMIADILYKSFNQEQKAQADTICKIINTYISEDLRNNPSIRIREATNGSNVILTPNNLEEIAKEVIHESKKYLCEHQQVSEEIKAYVYILMGEWCGMLIYDKNHKRHLDLKEIYHKD
ncbi:hypothetical protein H8D83_01855 [Candidatus Woesearchaeota archaeon]|nr:hypothetical protein [Candidatus Woesearchaeota archaeon]MBL7050698.1 hypothetical protein [Candidatus Woesearchaeota archaeon]